MRKSLSFGALRQLSNQNPDQLALIILLTCASSLYFGSQIMTQRLLAHPAAQVLQRDPQTINNQTTTAGINIIRTQPPTATPPQPPATLHVNQLFPQKPSLPTTEATLTPAAIDYWAKLKETPHLTLNGTTHNGAIINGRFYPVGAPIESLAYPAPGEDPDTPTRLVTPRITQVTATGVTITEPTPTPPASQKPRTLHLSLN